MEMTLQTDWPLGKTKISIILDTTVPKQLMTQFLHRTRYIQYCVDQRPSRTIYVFMRPRIS